DELLLLERIADLDRRPLLGRLFVETGRGQDAGPADAVAPGRRPEQHRQVPDTFGPGQHQALFGEHAETENVHQGIGAVAGVEDDFPADGGYADRIAIAGDPGDHTFDQIAVAGDVERAETQGVHQSDRTGPHGENVADDPADAGGRPLVGLHRRRMVVALDPQ